MPLLKQRRYCLVFFLTYMLTGSLSFQHVLLWYYHFPSLQLSLYISHSMLPCLNITEPQYLNSFISSITCPFSLITHCCWNSAHTLQKICKINHLSYSQIKNHHLTYDHISFHLLQLDSSTNSCKSFLIFCNQKFHWQTQPYSTSIYHHLHTFPLEYY